MKTYSSSSSLINNDTLIDKYLISKCLAGQKQAYNIVYNNCIAYVYTTVKRYISDEEDIKDVIQETFIQVFNNLKSFDDNKGSWNTWLRKIAINQCLMHLRANKKLSLLTSLDDQHDQPNEDNSINLDSLSRQDITNMLLDMPNGYKVIFIMYIFDGFDHSEIAKALGITNETSRSQLNRAKKWLKNQIINDHKFKAYGLF